jgi:hypothetical protein
MAQFLRSAVLATVALLLVPAAQAQALDAVEVQQLGADAEIIVRFATSILYMNHNPQEEGKSVRVYLKLVGVGMQESDLAPDTRRVPAAGSAPAATVMFPEPDGSLSIGFDRTTRFKVSPGSDGRSIRILVPARTGG